MSFDQFTTLARAHVDDLRGGGWRTWLYEFSMAFIGLFILDVSWRFMDFLVDSGLAYFPFLDKILGDH